MNKDDFLIIFLWSAVIIFIIAFTSSPIPPNQNSEPVITIGTSEDNDDDEFIATNFYDGLIWQI